MPKPCNQADEHCKAESMQIVGYYQANEMCDDLELGPFGKKIAEKIRAQCQHAAVILVGHCSSPRPPPSPSPMGHTNCGAD